jgi:hypothetical protein
MNTVTNVSCPPPTRSVTALTNTAGQVPTSGYSVMASVTAPETPLR